MNFFNINSKILLLLLGNQHVNKHWFYITKKAKKIYKCKYNNLDKNKNEENEVYNLIKSL